MSSDIEKNWISIQNTDFDDAPIKKYSENRVVIQLLANKGILKEEQVFSFLTPAFKDLHDPFLLPNMNNAVLRIKRAIENNERVIIFGDYDTDGIVSTAILHNFLKKLFGNTQVECYIPDRFEEGYDINLGFVKEISARKKYDLIICVDCGTNAIEVIDFIESGTKNPDMIACDHHEPADARKEPESIPGMPDNLGKKCRESSKYMVINPKLPGSEYPFKDLSGAGVTFKFIHAILNYLDEKIKETFPKNYLKTILDLVAISTIADLMPLTGENRIMVKAGLKLLKNTKNPGMGKMIETVLEDKDQITVYDIGFIISPRLNASGRIKNARRSLDLLLEPAAGINQTMLTYDEISGLIDELDKFNRDRQEIQKRILTEILKNNDFKKIIHDRRIFIDKSQTWNEGVLGIVASDIVKRFNIPVILFRQSGDMLKGSGRSISGFDLYENLSINKKHFTRFGGHSQACGITMDIKDFDIFKEEITNQALNKLSEESIRKRYYYDMELSFKDIEIGLIKEIERLEPFGIGNPRPLFLARTCTIISDPLYLKNDRHVVFRLKNDGKIFESIIFNFMDSGHLRGSFKRGNVFNVLFNIEKSTSQVSNMIKISLNVQSMQAI